MEPATPLILFEDDELIVISKPPHMHSVSLSEEGLATDTTVAGWLARRNPASRSVSDRVGDAGLINRLDFETSGLIIGAKARRSYERLRESIKASALKKDYLAVLEGEIGSEACLESHIGSPNRGAHKMRVFTRKPAARMRALPAKTEYRKLAYHAGLDVSLVRVVAASARRHQIRAHSGFLGHPLVGDSLYGAKRTTSSLFSPLPPAGLPTFFLHAYTISLAHPTTGETLFFEAAPPQRYIDLFPKALGR